MQLMDLVSQSVIDGCCARILGKYDVNAAKLQETNRVNDVDVIIFMKCPWTKC